MHDLHAATRRLADVVGQVDDAQLDAPTPCPDYRVGDLLDHVGGLAVAFTEAAHKHHAVNAAPPPLGARAHLAADWRTRIPTDLEALADAWAMPEAWDGDTTIAGATMPAAVVGTVGLNEVVTHGWDLARAIGRPFEADSGSIAGCMEFLVPMSDPAAAAQRGPAFGPVVIPRDDASPLERVIALNGRDPDWTAPPPR